MGKKPLGSNVVRFPTATAAEEEGLLSDEELDALLTKENTSKEQVTAMSEHAFNKVFGKKRF